MSRRRDLWDRFLAVARNDRQKTPHRLVVATPKGKTIASGFQPFLSKLGLTSTTATAVQRIGALLAEEREKALAELRHASSRFRLGKMALRRA
jgi:hypothetical protein